MNDDGLNIIDPELLKERLFAQDEKLLKVTRDFASKIKELPLDPKYGGAEPRALLVGGFVRDSLMGKFPKDADMEVYGVSPEQLEKLLELFFPEKINKVGKSFGILKVSISEGTELDVSIPRRESKHGTGHSGFTVDSDPGMSIEEAAKRRDFTVNTLSFDPLSGELFDPYGGVSDLKKKILRVTDKERFQDDPLRIYRAMQFVARLGFTVEEESLKLMRKMVESGTLEELGKERITEEIKKLLLKAEKPSLGLELAMEIGVVEKYYPELYSLTKTEQEKDWHPEGNVWIHSLMVMDTGAKIIREEDRNFSEEEKLEVMIGSLCHDLGKPMTTEIIDGKIRSLGHEEAGREPTKKLLDKFSFGDKVNEAAINIAAEHLKPSMLYKAKEKGELDDKQYNNAVRKLIKRIYPLSWKVLLASSEADFRGRGLKGVDTEIYLAGELLSKAVVTNGLDEEPKKSLVSGKDIIRLSKELGADIQPGKIFKELITEVEMLRDSGEITTTEEALIKLKEVIKKKL